MCILKAITLFPRAYFNAWAQVLRIVDGPDAVHRRSVAREDLRHGLTPEPTLGIVDSSRSQAHEIC
jgi:hypothetical protein